VDTVQANRVTLITLGVADLALSKAFYATLGWVLEEATDDVAFYDMGGAKFGLYSLKKMADELDLNVEDLGCGASNLSQNYPTEDAVDAAYDLALSAGAKPLKQPAPIFWGGYSGAFADLDGHIWEVACNPFWPLNDKGRIA
jgi:predicted lactoylglutathione lyase